MLEVHGPGMTTLDDDEKLASVFAADAMWDALEVVRRRTQALGLADVSLGGAVAALQAEGQLPYDPLTLDWHPLLYEPPGEVIFDHPYNAGSVCVLHAARGSGRHISR